MTNRTRTILICVLCLIMLAGICGLLYSPFADWYNRQHKAEIESAFNDVIENADNAVLTAEKEAAMKYNEDLYNKTKKLFDPYKSGYFKRLNLTGNNMMGMIRIPCIDVSLPIYHDVSDSVLAKGVGHIPQTSLPVGGENTHSALSAHSGLASSSLFSELERVRIGDFFYIDILGETLIYQVEQIDVVLPDQSEILNIVTGKDLVTLITCTPYSVNTHRLLVRGSRFIPNEDGPIVDEPGAETSRGMPVRTKFFLIGIGLGSLAGGFLFFILAIVVIYISRRKNAKKTGSTMATPAPINPVTTYLTEKEFVT